MAEPVIHGSIGSSPFTSQYVDVTEENLSIKIDEKFRFAQFHIEYHIQSDIDGNQIPLLFYASDIYDSTFQVSIDGVPIVLKEIPYGEKLDGKFSDFTYFFEQQGKSDYYYVMIDEDENTGFSITLDDMRYFETNISKGEHIITVNYTASCWVDQWELINKYSFRYALSPAKYWRSFGKLNISLDLSSCSYTVFTNLPTTDSSSSIMKWEFDELPVDLLMINFHPEINEKAFFYIGIGPMNLALFLGVFLVLAHLFWVKIHRKRNFNKRFSTAVIIGSIVVPFIYFITWFRMYDFIDWMIGEHASGKHGYYFLLFIFLPFVLPVYWVVIWLYDRYLRQKLDNTKNPS